MSTSTPASRSRTLRARLIALGGGIAAAILVLALTLRIEAYERQRYVQDVRHDTLRYASVIRARLEAALNSRLHLTYGLGAYAKTHPDYLLSDFDSFAEELMRNAPPGIRSMQLAPNAVVHYVYPLKGNETVRNHDLLADPARREAVQRAIRERLFVVAGPFPLIQGGQGMVARQPLFIDRDGIELFWGFSTVVLDVEPVLAEGGLQPSLDSTYLAALRGKDGLGDKGGVFFGDEALFDGRSVTLDVTLPHGTWQLAVRPAHGWPETGPFTLILRLAGALLAVAAGALAYQRLFAGAYLRDRVEKAVAALKDSEEQFRSVAESATDAIISCDNAGRVAFWNHAAEKIFHYTADEAMGRQVSELVIPPQSRSSHPKTYFVAEMMGGDRLGRVIDTVAMRKDGSVFPVELSLSHWTQAGSTYFTAILRDVTERKAAEREQALLKERYFQAQKMEAIGTLASGAAHEFNNILNGLLANTERAMGELPPDSPATPSLYEVLEAGWRAAEIVRQLLVFSEQQNDKVTRTVPVPAIEGLLARLEMTLESGITVKMALAPTGRVLSCDHDQFCHMVWNLCMNGVHALVPDGGELSVELAEYAGHAGPPPEFPGLGSPAAPAQRLMLGELREGDYLRISVGDTGKGMDGETLMRSFEPFFTTANVGEGTGLGLSVVLGVVQNCGGCIAVTTAKDAGSRFDIYLPAEEGG